MTLDLADMIFNFSGENHVFDVIIEGVQGDGAKAVHLIAQIFQGKFGILLVNAAFVRVGESDDRNGNRSGISRIFGDIGDDSR